MQKLFQESRPVHAFKMVQTSFLTLAVVKDVLPIILCLKYPYVAPYMAINLQGAYAT